MIRHPPSLTLFPSPPLFRSPTDIGRAQPGAEGGVHRPLQLGPRLGESLAGAAASEPVEHHRRREQHRRRVGDRSEEHTSELQSRQYLVCRLLLEKKKKPYIHIYLIPYDKHQRVLWNYLVINLPILR